MKLINLICHHPLGGLVAILILLPPFLPLWWFTDGKYLIANRKSKMKSQMTCKDCKYYKPNTEFIGKCEALSTNMGDVYASCDAEPCKIGLQDKNDIQINDSWDEVSK